MSKIIFAGPNQDLYCKKCRSLVPPMDEGSEDGQLDSYWCEHCIGFVSVIAMNKIKEYAYVELTKGFYSKIDKEDLERVCKFKWYARYSGKNNKVYAARNGKWIKGGIREAAITLQDFIMDTKYPNKADHIDSDSLNNTKNNLRPCTQQQNCWNRRVMAGKAIPYKGVSRISGSSKFSARIRVNKKCVSLGSYKTAEDAAMAYDEAARINFGEFAWTNFKLV